MPYGYFITWNLIGGATWVATFTLLGFFFGNIPFVQKNFELVIVAIILISLVPAVVEGIKARKEMKQQSSEVDNLEVMPSLALLSGGISGRMGQDKALMPFLGRPLILRILERLASIADEVILSTNHPADYAFLGLPLHPDFLPDRGALGGLYTSLMAAHGPVVAAVACDMPFANPALFEYESELLSEDGGRRGHTFDIARVRAFARGLSPRHLPAGNQIGFGSGQVEAGRLVARSESKDRRAGRSEAIRSPRPGLLESQYAG